MNRTLNAGTAELMILLSEAAIRFCEAARENVERNEYTDAHSQLVDNITRLFQFVFYRLFEANLSHNPRRINEAISVLTVLRNAWAEAEG